MFGKTVTPGTAQAVKLLFAADGLDFDEVMSIYQKYRDQEPRGRKDCWLTIKEAMGIARVSRATLWRWIRGGQVKAVKLSKARCGKILLSSASLEALLASKCVVTGVEAQP